jgi:hypothetical protein
MSNEELKTAWTQAVKDLREQFPQSIPFRCLPERLEAHKSQYLMGLYVSEAMDMVAVGVDRHLAFAKHAARNFDKWAIPCDSTYESFLTQLRLKGETGEWM